MIVWTRTALLPNYNNGRDGFIMFYRFIKLHLHAGIFTVTVHVQTERHLSSCTGLTGRMEIIKTYKYRGSLVALLKQQLDGE